MRNHLAQINMSSKVWLPIVVGGFLNLMLSGCASWVAVQRYKPVGAQCNELDLNDPVPFVRGSYGSDVVGLACSGGGSRAAYLTAAILREIHREGIRLDGGTRSPNNPRDLLEQVDAISSVSGGSLAAAYFVANSKKLEGTDVYSKEWNDYLYKVGLPYRPRQWRSAFLNPLNWVKILFTNYNRGLLARDDYDRRLFGGTTLADLPDRPALYLNAFDVQNHVRFVLSKEYTDTTYYQPKNWWGKLGGPQAITSENDMSFSLIDPASVRVADAVYASSAYPFVYPNFALTNFSRNRILFQGSLIFLADGGLADNSGLITLLTEFHRRLADAQNNARVVVIYIDASLDRINPEGTSLQQSGDEDRYPWHHTILGHGKASIASAVEMLQDLGWKFVESTGAVTDQINANWQRELSERRQIAHDADGVSWNALLESHAIAQRPVVIRLGLRDVVNPNASFTHPELLPLTDPLFRQLLTDNGLDHDVKWLWSAHLASRLQAIKTDFALSPSDRRLLDLAAFLLVHFTLADDLNELARIAQARVP